MDNKFFFRCRQAEYTECGFDYQWQLGATESAASMLPATVNMDYPLTDFATTLRYYTRRSLTNQDDVLRALAGMIRRFSERVKHRFFEGMPTAAFDAFIIFRSSRGALLHRRNGFPSYSWVGWKGSIDIDHTYNDVDYSDMNDWLSTRTWIVWYKKSRSGVTNLVWDPAANESFPFHNPEYVGYRARGALRLPPALRTTSRTAPTEDLAFDTPHPTYPLLQFWTLALYYKISNINVFEAKGDVLGDSGTVCGEISLDGFEETTFFDSGGMFEFILLSEWRPDLYNIMLLEWNGGLAERRGIGTIDQSAIDMSFSPGPVWKEILLG